jgi:hypothetical protein
MNTRSSKIKIPNSILIEAFKTLTNNLKDKDLNNNISNKENDISKTLEYN